jgi:hypothetical protein
MSIINVRPVAMFFLAFLLSACASTKTYKDAGVYNGESYVFDITWEDEGFFRTTYLSINEALVLTIDRETNRAADCQKTSYLVIRCIYNTQYEGKAVEVVHDYDAQFYQQNSYYSISINGTLVRRITTPIM